MKDEEITREAVIKNVISTFIDNIGYLSEREKLSVNGNTDIIKDFKMNTDDATLMIMDLKKNFSINPSHEEWLQLSSINETADLIIKHLNEKP